MDHQKRLFPFTVPSEDGERSIFRSVVDFYPKVAENVQNFRHVLELLILVFFIEYRDDSETKGEGGGVKMGRLVASMGDWRST